MILCYQDEAKKIEGALTPDPDSFAASYAFDSKLPLHEGGDEDGTYRTLQLFVLPRLSVGAFFFVRTDTVVVLSVFAQ